MTKAEIAKILNLPDDEIEKMLFGLAAGNDQQPAKLSALDWSDR